MDSGSWFAIWAICLRTSFFVMMPRSLLEKKQNREKRSASQYRLMPVPNPQRPFHRSTRRDISQPPLRRGGSNWVSSGQWRVGGGERYPSRVSCTFPLSSSASPRQRSQWRALRSQRTESGVTRFKDLGSGMAVWCKAHTCCNPHWSDVGEKLTFIVFGHWDCSLVYYSSRPMMTNMLP